MLSSLLGKLHGRKTHLVAAGMVIFAVLGLVLGMVDSQKAVELILQALGLSALRAGVAKAIPEAE